MYITFDTGIIGIRTRIARFKVASPNQLDHKATKHQPIYTVGYLSFFSPRIEPENLKEGKLYLKKFYFFLLPQTNFENKHLPYFLPLYQMYLKSL